MLFSEWTIEEHVRRLHFEAPSLSPGAGIALNADNTDEMRILQGPWNTSPVHDRVWSSAVRQSQTALWYEPFCCLRLSSSLLARHEIDGHWRGCLLIWNVIFTISAHLRFADVNETGYEVETRRIATTVSSVRFEVHTGLLIKSGISIMFSP